MGSFILECFEINGHRFTAPTYCLMAIFSKNRYTFFENSSQYTALDLKVFPKARGKHVTSFCFYHHAE